MTFHDFKLDNALLRAVEELGFRTPMPIQAEAVPAVLDGRDVLGKAQTGTGKTAAFGLPILQKLLPDSQRRPRALVVLPTRELAHQVDRHLAALAKHTPLKGACITGGENFANQEHVLRQGTDWITATPGRLLAHLEGKYVDFGAIEFLVLDEADQLLELGFLPDIQRIVSYLPERRQTLLFSATLPAEMQHLARALLSKPARIDIGETTTAEPVREELWRVASQQKFDLLRALMDRRKMESALIFTRTRRRANTLSEQLKGAGIRAEELHAERPMEERRAALNAFREGTVPVLVATNLAARGLDISGISHVINFDVPTAPEDYIHRVGRTGRAGKTGEALTLMSADEEVLVAKIEHLTRKRIPEMKLDDFPYVDDRAGEEKLKPRHRRPASFKTRAASKEKKESPFTRSGKVRPQYEVPSPEKELKKKQKKRIKMKKKLPHEK